MVLYSQLKANVIFTNFAGKNSQEVSVFLSNYPVRHMLECQLHKITDGILMEHIPHDTGTWNTEHLTNVSQFSQSSLDDLNFNLAAGETGLVSVCNQ